MFRRFSATQDTCKRASCARMAQLSPKDSTADRSWGLFATMVGKSCRTSGYTLHPRSTFKEANKNRVIHKRIGHDTAEHQRLRVPE